MNKEIIDYYLATYCERFEIYSDKNTQEKRVKSLISKLMDKTSIYKDLPFEILSIDEQAKLIHYILEKSPERQIIANMKKIDVDRDYYNFILQDENLNELNTKILNQLDGWEPYDIAEYMLSNRVLIKNTYSSISDILKELNYKNEYLIRLFIDEIQKFKVLGLGFEYNQYIKDYIDYASDGILQFLNYKIIANTKINASDLLEKLASNLRYISERIDNQLDEKRKFQSKLGNLDAEKITRYFSLYRTHYSKFYELLNIYDILQLEMDENKNLFAPLNKRYFASKNLISEEEIVNLKEIITEGIHSYDYNEKLKLTRRFIDIMQIYGFRNCFSNSPQDLKVYYRELFMSNITYRNKQAATIIKDYINKIDTTNKIESFEKQSHYLFVSTKISRGYFREKGLLDLYSLRIKFEKSLYDTLLKLYLFYDFKDSLEFIYEVNYSILKVISEYFLE